MKKLLIITGMLFATVALTACGGGDDALDAFELLERSHEAQEAALADGDISMTIDMVADVNVDMEGVAFSMPMTMRMEIESEDRTSMVMNTEMMGQEMSMTMFVRDGYQYSEEIDLFTGHTERTREEVDMASAEEIAAMLEMDFSDIAEDWFEEATAKSTDDGYRLEFVFNMEGLANFLDDFDMGLPEEMGELFDYNALDEDADEDSKSSMIMYLDENYMPILTTMSFELSTTVEEMGMTMDMTMALTMEMRIEDVTIDFPDWLDEIAAGLNFEDSALLGYWEGGSGRIFLWVFGSADSVEFFVDGTLIITEDGERTIVDWEPVEAGIFIAGDEIFAYSIQGNVLTITDSSDDSWSFYREGTAPVIEDPVVEDEDDDDDDSSSTSTEDVPREFRNALGSARDYLRFMNFSFEGLSGQLDWEGYSAEAIAWAMEQIDAETDWYEQAVGSAESYLEFMSFSPSSLVDQLVFDGFTRSQAQHAVDIAFD